MILEPRTNKEYNIDHYREQILVKRINHHSMLEIYKKLVLFYIEMFKDKSNYSFVLNKLLMKMMQKMFNKNIFTFFESEYVETLRPFVNTFIEQLRSNIIEISKDEDDIFFCVVGGDAVRRYQDDKDNNNVRTNDFDLKVFLFSHTIQLFG